MESKRQQKYAKLVQKELGEIFLKELNHVIGKAMVTVTRVFISSDLSLARVYLSFLNANPQNAFDEIQLHKKELRYHLARRVGKSVRIVPELALFIDDSASYAQHMDQVISRLDIPPNQEEEEN